MLAFFAVVALLVYIDQNYVMRNQEHKPKDDPKAKREERARRKRRVMALLYDGIPYRKIEELTGVNHGSVSRIKKSAQYLEFEAAQIQLSKEAAARHNLGDGLESDAAEVAKHKSLDTVEYRHAEKRDRFIQALGVGGLSYARLYAKCSIEEAAAFIADVDVLHHAARPRIAVLGVLLKIASDKTEGTMARIKAAAEWWRLASGHDETPLIQINSNTSESAGPTPTEIMIRNMEGVLEKVEGINLMKGSADDSAAIVVE